MKLPNSYGSVIKLGGKRRKPYAVRISKLVEDDTGFTAMLKRLQSQIADYNFFFYASRTKGNVPICKIERVHRPGFNGRSGL